jgi:hypothetical protein
MSAIAPEIMVFILSAFLALRITQMHHMAHLSGKIVQYVIGFLDQKVWREFDPLELCWFRWSLKFFVCMEGCPQALIHWTTSVT